MAYTLANMRQLVRLRARNAKDSSEYPDFDIDDSILAAADRMLRRTRATRRLDTLTLTAGSNVIPTLPTGFRPELVLQTFLTLAGQVVDPAFTIASYEEVQAAQFGPPEGWVFPVATSSTDTGRPRIGGFIDRSNAIVYPTPDQAYVIQLWWWEAFTAWTPGAQGAWSPTTAYYPGDVVSLGGDLYECLASNTNSTPPDTDHWLALGAGTVETPTALTFNLPDDHLRSIGRYGAPALLQLGEEERGEAAKLFLSIFDQDAIAFASRAAGSRGGQVSIKRQPE